MDRERARRMGDRLPGRNMLEALAMGLAVPVLIVPAMLIIFHAPDMGPIWVPLLLGYLTLFTVVGGLLWKKRAKDQFHFLVGDEIFYRDYPRDLQKALKAARREGIPPEVQRTLELYSDVTGGPCPRTGRSAGPSSNGRRSTGLPWTSSSWGPSTRRSWCIG